MLLLSGNKQRFLLLSSALPNTPSLGQHAILGQQAVSAKCSFSRATSDASFSWTTSLTTDNCSSWATSDSRTTSSQPLTRPKCSFSRATSGASFSWTASLTTAQCSFSWATCGASLSWTKCLVTAKCSFSWATSDALGQQAVNLSLLPNAPLGQQAVNTSLLPNASLGQQAVNLSPQPILPPLSQHSVSHFLCPSSTPLSTKNQADSIITSDYDCPWNDSTEKD